MASAFKWRLTDTLYSYLTDENGGQPQINSGYTSDVESIISQKVVTNFGSEQAYAAQFRIMTDMIASNPATKGVTLLNYSYYYDMNDNSCGFISGGVGDKGSQGQKGDKGDKGDRGNDGRGVRDVMFYPLPKNVGTRVTFYFTDGTSTSFDVMNGEVGGTMNIDYNYLLSGLTNMGLPEQIIHTIENDMYPELQDYFDSIFNGAMADINAMKRALSGVTHDIGSLHFYVDYLSGQTGTLAQYYDADHQALNTIDQLISALSGLVRTNLERVDGLNSAVTRVGQELNVMSGYIRNYVEEVKILDEATSSFTRDMSEIMQTARYIEQTVEHISGDIRDLSDQVQTASSVTTTISHQVYGLTTDMLRMQETYSSLTVDIQHISGDVRNATQIAQTASGVAINAARTVCGVTTDVSQLKVSYSSITADVRAISGDVTNATRMAQNASGLSINAARAVCGVTTDVSQLKVSYSSITADVRTISGDVTNATQIAQTANSTALYAFNTVCGVTRDVSQLKVSYSSITADVRTISGDVENATKVAQTASGVAINAERTVCGVTTDVAQLKVSYSGMSSQVQSLSGNMVTRSEIKQVSTAITAYVFDELDTKTGIDITTGKITNRANQWECRNNNDQKIAWLDDMGNFTIQGVYNNLITVINSGNCDNYIIKHTDSNYHDWWYLDVLRCGNYVRIDYLPEAFRNASENQTLYLPFYANSGLKKRGYTRYLASSTSTPRLMTTDELRMLAGRKMMITWGSNVASNQHAIGYIYEPDVYYGSIGSDLDKTQARLKNLMVGQKHFITLGNSEIDAAQYNRSPAFYIPRTLVLSFELVKFHEDQNSPNYTFGYIWMADDDSSVAAMDEIAW